MNNSPSFQYHLVATLVLASQISPMVLGMPVDANESHLPEWMIKAKDAITSSNTTPPPEWSEMIRGWFQEYLRTQNVTTSDKNQASNKFEPFSFANNEKASFRIIEEPQQGDLEPQETTSQMEAPPQTSKTDFRGETWKKALQQLANDEPDDQMALSSSTQNILGQDSKLRSLFPGVIFNSTTDKIRAIKALKQKEIDKVTTTPAPTGPTWISPPKQESPHPEPQVEQQSSKQQFQHFDPEKSAVDRGVLEAISAIASSDDGFDPDHFMLEVIGEEDDNENEGKRQPPSEGPRPAYMIQSPKNGFGANNVQFEAHDLDSQVPPVKGEDEFGRRLPRNNSRPFTVQFHQPNTERSNERFKRPVEHTTQVMDWPISNSPSYTLSQNQSPREPISFPAPPSADFITRAQEPRYPTQSPFFFTTVAPPTCTTTTKAPRDRPYPFQFPPQGILDSPRAPYRGPPLEGTQMSNPDHSNGNSQSEFSTTPTFSSPAYPSRPSSRFTTKSPETSPSTKSTAERTVYDKPRTTKQRKTTTTLTPTTESPEIVDDDEEEERRDQERREEERREKKKSEEDRRQKLKKEKEEEERKREEEERKREKEERRREEEERQREERQKKREEERQQEEERKRRQKKKLELAVKDQSKKLAPNEPSEDKYSTLDGDNEVEFQSTDDYVASSKPVFVGNAIITITPISPMRATTKSWRSSELTTESTLTKSSVLERPLSTKLKLLAGGGEPSGHFAGEETADDDETESTTTSASKSRVSTSSEEPPSLTLMKNEKLYRISIPVKKLKIGESRRSRPEMPPTLFYEMEPVIRKRPKPSLADYDLYWNQEPPGLENYEDAGLFQYYGF